MVQTRGGTKTYSKEKSPLQKINDLFLVGYGWILRAPTTQQNHEFRSLLLTIGPSKRMT
jgi:hypothetical protein